MTLLPARMNWMLLAGLFCLFTAGTAAAQSNPTSCVNDDDCIATPACGGDVCDWNVQPTMTCKPAGGSTKGMDGWCSTTDDCKCKGMGATCMNFFCTFTRPCDAPGAGPCGSTGAAGSTGGGGSTGAAGTTGAAGSTSTGTAGTSGGGSSDGGGCAVAATAPLGGSTLLVALGLLAFARRRRR